MLPTLLITGRAREMEAKETGVPFFTMTFGGTIVKVVIGLKGWISTASNTVGACIVNGKDTLKMNQNRQCLSICHSDPERSEGKESARFFARRARMTKNC